MAREDLVYKVGVDASDAVSGLRKLEGAVRSTMSEVGDELDDSATAGDKFAASIDRLSSQMREDFNSAAIAAEELQRALRDAGSGLEVGDALAELKRMGISFDEITQGADQFATSLKQLDDVRLAGVKDLDSVAPGLASKLDDVGKSADSSKSALANMIGNTAQDLGAVSGIAGSLGVGLGQLGEYAADAALGGEKLGSALLSMAKVAGPMAALGIATAVVSSEMKRAAESKAFNAAQLKAFAKSMDETGSVISAINDQLEDTGQLVFKIAGGFDAIDVGGDIAPLLAALNLSTAEFLELVNSSPATWTKFMNGLKAAGVAEEDLINIQIAHGRILSDQAKATEVTALKTELLADGTDRKSTRLNSSHRL